MDVPEPLAVLIAGMVGGVAHALVFYGEITMPSSRVDGDGRKHWNPGILGTLFIGGVASLVFWGFYGEDVSWGSPAEVRPVIGALLIGVAGDRALKAFVNQAVAESDKRDLEETVRNLTDGLLGLLPEKEEQNNGDE